MRRSKEIPVEFHLGHNFTPKGFHAAGRDFTASSTSKKEQRRGCLWHGPSFERQGGRGVVTPPEQRLSMDTACSPPWHKYLRCGLVS